jgi:hypothetical protein
MSMLHNQFVKSLLALSFVIFGVAGTARAAILVTYPFNAAPAASKDPTAVAGVVASQMSDAVGDFDVSTSSGTAFLRGTASENSLANAIMTPDYLQFTLTPAAGQVMSLTSFIFDHLASNDTTTAFTSNLSIFASLNGFATTPAAGDALGTSTVTVNASIGAGNTLLGNDVAFSLSAPAFQNLTSSSTVTFRIYGFDNATGSEQINRIDDIRIDGQLTAVPEPSSMLLALSGFGLVAWRQLRRRAA